MANRLQADHKLRLDEDFVASKAQDALRGRKKTFQKEETQEKSYEQRCMDLEKKMELLMKGQKAVV